MDNDSRLRTITRPDGIRWVDIWIPAVLIMMILAVYLRIIRFELVDIDDFAIAIDLQNRIRAGENILLTFTRIPLNTLYWAPVSVFLYILDVVAWGERTHLYHLSNLLLHLSCTLLIFGIFKRLTGHAGRSALAAMLFAVHPVNTNAVVIWGNRYTLVEAFFVLVTLAVYAFYARQPRMRSYLLVLLSFAAALLAKSTAVYLPLLMLLFDFWPLRRVDPADKRNPRKILRLSFEKAPFLGIAALWALFAIYFFRAGTYVGADGLMHTSLASVPFNAPVIYAGYIIKTIIPTHLPLFHLNFPMRAPIWLTLLSLGFLAGVTAVTIRCCRSRPYLAFGWFWYLITISPYALPVSMYSLSITTRYMYIPGIGLFVMAAWGLRDIASGSAGRKKIVAITGVGLITAFMAASFTQSEKLSTVHRYSRHTADSLVRCGRYALMIDPGNAMAHHSVGTACSQRGDHEEAIDHFRNALKLNPRDYASLHNLAGVLIEMGDVDTAIDYYYAALEINPLLYQTHNNLATALARRGDVQAAVSHLQRALEIRPDYHTARMNLHQLMSQREKAGP